MFFSFNDTATTEIYTLSLHDALPIFITTRPFLKSMVSPKASVIWPSSSTWSRTFRTSGRSEEHTSELQSLRHLVCRLLLEKKKNTKACNNEVNTRCDTHHMTINCSGK